MSETRRSPVSAVGSASRADSSRMAAISRPGRTPRNDSRSQEPSPDSGRWRRTSTSTTTRAMTPATAETIKGFTGIEYHPPRRETGRARPAFTESPRAGRSDGLVQPLADDGGHTVAAHRHAVQGVGDLQRPLLVRDDDQLGVLAQLREDLQQPAEVDVVERRLDLVHDVERAGSRLEDRDQQRDGGQRPLAAREQREPLDLLARRPRLHLEPGREHVVGVGEQPPALAAGEQPAEDALELARGVGERLGEDGLDALVDLADDLLEVGARLLEVG